MTIPQSTTEHRQIEMSTAIATPPPSNCPSALAGGSCTDAFAFCACHYLPTATSWSLLQVDASRLVALLSSAGLFILLAFT